MARLYETKEEQYNREYPYFIRGETPPPPTMPPRIVKSTPRYQTLAQAGRLAASKQVKLYKAFRRVTGQSPI